MCLVNVNALGKYDLIFKDQEYGLKIFSTIYGKLMARYYLSFKTMKLFRQIKGDESLRDLFDLLTQCHEFNDFNIRVSDKKILNELNSSKTNEIIRFKIKGRVKTVTQKVSWYGFDKSEVQLFTNDEIFYCCFFQSNASGFRFNGNSRIFTSTREYKNYENC